MLGICIRVVVALLAIVLLVGIVMHYIINTWQHNTYMCNKGRFLTLVEESTPVYTKVKGHQCETIDDGVIVIWQKDQK